MQIVDLVRGLEAEPDPGTVQDALDAEMAEGDLSDVSTRRAAAAVVKALPNRVRRSSGNTTSIAKIGTVRRTFQPVATW